MQGSPAEITGRQVGACECSDGTGGCRNIRLGISVGSAGRGNAKDSATAQIAHAMSANARIVPIGNEQRAIGSHAGIGRAEPLVGDAFEHVHGRSLVASAIVLDRIGSRDTGASIAVNHLVLENFG